MATYFSTGACLPITPPGSGHVAGSCVCKDCTLGKNFDPRAYSYPGLAQVPQQSQSQSQQQQQQQQQQLQFAIPPVPQSASFSGFPLAAADRPQLGFPSRSFDFSAVQSHYPHPPQYRLPTQQQMSQPVVDYEGPHHYQPAPQDDQEKPTGGVCAVLDYKIEDMAKFLAITTMALFKCPQSWIMRNNIEEWMTAVPLPSPSDSFVCWIHGVLTAIRLPTPSFMYALSYMLAQLRNSQTTVSRDDESEMRLYLTIALILGSVINDDNTFNRKSWSAVTGFDGPTIGKHQIEWLENVDYGLSLNYNSSPDDAGCWENLFKTFCKTASFTPHAPSWTSSPILGPVLSTSPVSSIASSPIASSGWTPDSRSSWGSARSSLRTSPTSSFYDPPTPPHQNMSPWREHSPFDVSYSKHPSMSSFGSLGRCGDPNDFFAPYGHHYLHHSIPFSHPSALPAQRVGGSYMRY